MGVCRVEAALIACVSENRKETRRVFMVEYPNINFVVTLKSLIMMTIVCVQAAAVVMVVK